MLQRSIAVMAAVLVAMVVTAPAAEANTRESYLVTFEPGHPHDTGFCDFPVIDEEIGTFLVSDFFDNDGNIVQTLITACGQLTLTFTNPLNGKSVVTHNESQTGRITYEEDGSFDTLQRAGVIFAFTAPGFGAVLMQIGRVVEDWEDGIVFVTGQCQFLAGDFDELCAALA